MYRVLLVDDESYMLEGLKNIIHWDEHGLEIAAVASNGEQALEVLKQNYVDIVLTDIRMPSMNGLDLIHHIKLANEKVKVIILSGYDDFAYLKEAIKLGIENFLLKPVNQEELSQTLINTCEKIATEIEYNMKMCEDAIILKENILYRWVTGAISPLELLDRANLIAYNMDVAPFVVCILHLVNGFDKKMNTCGKSKHHERSMSSTLDICRTATNKFDGIEVFFDLNEDILFLFSGECAQDRENVKDMMKDCMRRINSELILDVFIAMGSEEQNFSTVHNSYTHAKSLMDYMLVYDGNCLVDYHEKQIISSNYLKYLYMPSGYLEKLVVSGKPEDCDRFVEQTYDRIFSHPDIAPEAVQSITIELLYSIIHLLSEKRVRQRDLPEFNQDPYKKVYTIRNKTELVDWMKATVQQVRAALKNEQEHVSPVVKRAQDYININYEKDISLKLLSSMWSVNASYLGQQFKIATGEMFSVYLNKVRIEKAQQLLLETKLNANEIGVKVGYPNSNYFYNCFKKMTGKFPTEYRKDLFAN